MKFTCGSCAAKYQIADEKIAGRTLKMKCRKCGHPIVVRGGSTGGAPRLSEASGRSKRPSLPGSAPSSAPASVPPPPTRPSRASGLGAEFRRQVSTTQAAAAAAPAPGDEWHVAIDEQPVGPLSRDEVARRVADQVIDETSLVWRDGFEAWRPLAEVAELASLLRARPALHRPPPMTGRRGATGRFSAARTTGRGHSVAGPRPRPSMPGPPPAPAARFDAGFFPDEDATTEHWGRPASAETSGSYGHHGHHSTESLAPPPPAGGASLWQNPAFVIMLVVAGFFSTTLALLVAKTFFDGSPQAAAPVAAAAEPSRAAAPAPVRLPDDDEIDRQVARSEPREPEPTNAPETPRAGSSTGGSDQGASEARAPSTTSSDLSDEDQALLARMRGSGDFGGPTVSAREVEDTSRSRAVGELDQRQVARVVNRNKRSLQQCYERAIRGVTEAPTVTYDVDVNIAPSGRVSRVSMSSRGASLPGLDDCFETAIKRWVFPPSAEGQPVSFPVVLQPT